MPHQNINLTESNAKWIEARVDGKKYTTASDAVNDLIEQARCQENEKIEKIRAMVIEVEESIEKCGHSNLIPEEPFDNFREKAKARGLL